MRLAALLLLGALSGCAVAPTENPWDDLTVETDPAAAPIDCGSFPAPAGATNEQITYDQAGTNDLEQYRVCSEANEVIAAEHAAQIGQLKLARKGLTEAGQAQRRVSDLKGEILQEERQHMFWERIGLWVIAIAGVAF